MVVDVVESGYRLLVTGVRQVEFRLWAGNHRREKAMMNADAHGRAAGGSFSRSLA